MKNGDYEDRVCGCLAGGALGDAFGYPVEFCSRQEIVARFGARGLREPEVDPGTGRLLVSDDTQMTMFTLEGLLRAGDSGQEERLESIRLAHLDWLDTQGGGAAGRASQRGTDAPRGWLVKRPAMRHRRAPGNTCLSALAAGGWGTPQHPINHSKGCGGVMRVAPIGLLCDLSPEQAFELAARAAALTHGHPSGYLSAGCMAALVRLLLDGASIAEAAAVTIPVLHGWEGSGETLAAVQAAMELAGHAAQDCAGSDVAAVPSRLGEGWVGEEALAIALWASVSASSFGDALSRATNHGGDSDSTTSLAGQLWGARHGLAGTPPDWIERLDVLEELTALADKLIAAAAGGPRS